MTIWTLHHGSMLWGLYSTQRLAQEARSRAARILGTTIYDDKFNISPGVVDWKSSTERQMEAENVLET